MFFTLKEMELAHQMHQLGLWKDPQYGDWYIHTPPDTLAKLITEDVLNIYYSEERNSRKRDYIWLPSWKQARNWLREKGFGEFQFSQNENGYSHCTIRCGEQKLSIRGIADLEIVYELMLQILQAEKALAPQEESVAEAPGA